MAEYNKLEDINEIISDASSTIDKIIQDVIKSFESQVEWIDDVEAEIDECFVQTELFDDMISNAVNIGATGDEEEIKYFLSTFERSEERMFRNEKGMLGNLWDSLNTLQSRLYIAIQEMPTFVKRMKDVVEDEDKGLMYINKILDDKGTRKKMFNHVFEEMGVKTINKEGDIEKGSKQEEVKNIFDEVKKDIIEIKKDIVSEEEETKRADKAEMDEEKKIRIEADLEKELEKETEKQQKALQIVLNQLKKIMNSKEVTEEDIKNLKNLKKRLYKLYHDVQKPVIKKLLDNFKGIIKDWGEETKSCVKINNYAERLVEILRKLKKIEEKIESSAGTESAIDFQINLEKITKNSNRIKELTVKLNNITKDVGKDEHKVFNTIEHYSSAFDKEIDMDFKEYNQERKRIREMKNLEKIAGKEELSSEKLDKDIIDFERAEEDVKEIEEIEERLLERWFNYFEKVHEVIEKADMSEDSSKIMENIRDNFKDKKIFEPKEIEELMRDNSSYAAHLKNDVKIMTKFIKSFKKHINSMGLEYHEFKKELKNFEDNLDKKWVEVSSFEKLEDLEGKFEKDLGKDEADTEKGMEKTVKKIDKEAELMNKSKKMMNSVAKDTKRHINELRENENNLEKREKALHHVYKFYKKTISHFRKQLSHEDKEEKEMKRLKGGFLNLVFGGKAEHVEQFKRIKGHLREIKVKNKNFEKLINDVDEKLQEFKSKMEDDQDSKIKQFCDAVVFFYTGIEEYFIGTKKKKGILEILEEESELLLEDIRLLTNIDTVFDKWINVYIELIDDLEKEIELLEEEDDKEKVTTMFKSMRDEMIKLLTRLNYFETDLKKLRKDARTLEKLFGGETGPLERIKKITEKYEKELKSEDKKTRKKVVKLLKDYLESVGA